MELPLYSLSTVDTGRELEASAEGGLTAVSLLEAGFAVKSI